MPITSDIDTGVAVVPAPRPSVFTPAFLVGTAGLVSRPNDTIDGGTNTNTAPVANTFDNLSALPVTASPGY